MSLLKSSKTFLAVGVVGIAAIIFAGYVWQHRDGVVASALKEYLRRHSVPTGQKLQDDNNKIPTVYINTEKEPWVRGEKIKGSIEIKGNGMIDDVQPQPISIHVRGNSTDRFAKKAYTIKAKDTIKIGNLDEGKKYVLLANYVDPSLLHTQVAMKIAETLGIPHVNHVQPVNMVVNGDYRGVYDLTEKVAVGRNGLDIDTGHGGMFIEFNADIRDGDGFILPGFESRIWCEIHAPKVRKQCVDTIALKAEMHSLVEAMTALSAADSVAMDDIGKQIDIESMASYALLQMLVVNDEWFYPRSLYLWRYDSDDKWHFDPVWDFDRMFDSVAAKSNPEVAITPQLILAYARPYLQFPPVFIPLMSTDEFRLHFNAKFTQLKARLPEIYDYVDGQADLLKEATAANAEMWPVRLLRVKEAGGIPKKPDSKANAEEIKWWLKERIEFMDSAPNWGLY